ncbi:MAG: FadR/GntR family transcriptional regulator [Candidatus Methylomirabilales bacterium]
MLKPVEKSSVIHQVVEKVREFILRSRLKDGTRLPSEHELSRQLRVSRPTVREALKVLETLGFVEKVPGRGAFVRHPTQAFKIRGRHYTRDEIAEASLLTHEVRLIVEIRCAYLAAQRADQNDLAQLEMALQQLTNALRVGDTSTAVLADIAFHNIVARATKNSALLTLIATIEPIITENRRNTIQSFDGEQLAAPHLDIYDAIKRQDPDGAALAMERHLKELMGYLFRKEVA